MQVLTWLGDLNDWEQQNLQPITMANSTSNLSIFGDVAVTATGKAFGVISREGQLDRIASWAFDDDLQDWASDRFVDLNGAWGA